MDMVLYVDDSPVQNGLVAWLDAGIAASYPGSGTIMYNLTGDTTISGTIQGTGSYTSSLGGAIVMASGSGTRVAVSPGTNKINTYNCTIFYAVYPTYNVAGTGQRASLSYRGSGAGLLYIGTTSVGGGSLFTYYSSAVPAGMYGPGIIPSASLTVGCVVVSASVSGSGAISHYINGVLAGSGTKTGGLTASYATLPVYLGWDAGGTNEYFQGNFHSWLHYDRVLSDAEIIQNFRCFQRRFGSQMVPATMSMQTDTVREGMIFWVDAGKTQSYPGSGNTMFDLSPSGLTASYSGSASTLFQSNGIRLNSGSNGDGIEAYNVNLPTFAGYPTFRCVFRVNRFFSSSIATNGAFQLFSSGRGAGHFDRAFYLHHNGIPAGELNSMGMAIYVAGVADGPGVAPWPITSGSLVDVCTVWHPTSSDFYFNGVYQNSTPHGVTASLQLAGIWSMSNNPPESTAKVGFDSTWHIAQVWNRELTQAEITYNYIAAKARFGI